MAALCQLKLNGLVTHGPVEGRSAVMTKLVEEQ